MNSNSFIVTKKQLELDLLLAPYDIWATTVHVLMLGRQDLIDLTVQTKILKSLAIKYRECQQKKFVIDPARGLHLTLESDIVKMIGDDGFFMHTGRSRNDQVTTAESLYLREKSLTVFSQILHLQNVLFLLASQNLVTVMPGYTHMQPAKPTTFAQWCLFYVSMLSQCLDTLKYITLQFDRCPLGAVESYGTSWKIDRKYTAKLLGFSNVWELPMAAISSRGFYQLALLGAIKDAGIVLGKIATDLLLFTTYEYGYISLSNNQAKQMDPVTGSSIMPQKKNPDVLELVRAISYELISFENTLSNVLTNLPMGYNRDGREAKEFFALGFEKLTASLAVISEVLLNLEINKEKMLLAVKNNYSMATDLADFISQKLKLPYRKVYKVVGELVKQKKSAGLSLTSVTSKELTAISKTAGLVISLIESEIKEALDPVLAVSKRTHVGGSGKKPMKKLLKKMKKEIQSAQNWVKAKQQNIAEAKLLTQKEVEKIIKL